VSKGLAGNTRLPTHHVALKSNTSSNWGWWPR